MNYTRFWIAASIIAVIIVVGFIFSVPHTHDVVQTATVQEGSEVPSVTVHDSFKKGVHTITGSFDVPNECTTVSAGAVTSGSASSTEHILVKISMSSNVGVCLQLPSRVTFSTTISAPPNLPLSATINGHEATTSVL